MITYPLHPNITAFTTTKNLGRDASLLCPALGVKAERFARPHQVHKTETYQITEAFFSLSPEEQKAQLEGIDAVIYDVRNACIGISTADCIPVLAYDPDHHCAAAIHAGWKGTVARIAPAAINMMVKAYGTNPANLLCAIGPGISLDSFEVGDEVYQAFNDAGFDVASFSKRYPDHLNPEHEKWHLDLKECNRQQLITLGVSPANIIVSELDTMTDERFYSARREGAKTGRILSGIVLR